VPKILVTGGAGYVGSVCCSQLLEKGHEVVAIDNLSTGHAEAVPKGVILYPIDIANREAVTDLLSEHRIDAVFHFAARALIPESVSNPGLFFAAGVNRFVFSSSAAVYGSPTKLPIAEDHPKDPVNSYGETKLMFERLLSWYASAYQWDVYAFRYFNASGATSHIGEDHYPETHIIPLLLQTVLGSRPYFEIFGRDYPTPDGTCLRDYVHVIDIAAAHLLAIETPRRSGMNVYNIGTGTSYSVLQICAAIEQVTGKKLVLKNCPRRAGDPAALCASPAKLKRELGWKPCFSDLSHIVRTAWQWALAHPDGYKTPVEELLTQPS
jgi:UDP-glucose 4-epimerase